MKVVKFYWEFHMSDADYENNKGIKEVINEVKCGKFQREIEAGTYEHQAGKVKKCIATVKVEDKK
jgi:hypothetical protein